MALRLDPKKSALVIQDLQNDVIMPGGAFTGGEGPGPAEHAQSQKVVANVKSIAAAARAAGMPVIHVWYVVDKGAPGLKLNAPLFEAVASGAVVRGSWGAAPVKGLEPKKGDLIVEKMRMNAFHDTNLETLLKGLGTETLVITGAWTNFSIEHTARHAADAGYRAVVVTDGTSTVNDEWQNAALNYALQNIAERVPTKDVVAALKRRTAARAK
jgi:gluconolactonase